MDFILPFNIEPSHYRISYSQKILFIGSCFTEEIGTKFKELKIDVLQNPNGILYDPRSIAYALDSYIGGKKYTRDELFLHHELWHSWQHHSAFSGIDQNAVLDKINESQSAATVFLKEASWLIITLGTSYNYQLKNNEEFVANCHKAPAAFFQKKLAALREIHSQLSGTIQKLNAFNPNLKIIFTVSPVRHVRDGVIENNRSKARLIETVHSLLDENENTFYFPAYELVIDVLRDYRFYKTDLVHVSDAGVNYVFEKFCEIYLDGNSIKTMAEIKSLRTAVAHRPFQMDSPGHKKFLEAQLAKARTLQEKNPAIDLRREIDYFMGAG